MLPGRFVICRFSADATVPEWAQRGGFTSITRAADELSIVCPAENLPPEHKPEPRWICLKLAGPFAFTETGILASFIDPLARARVGIFAISTFDTDYVLVQEQFSEKALAVLTDAGHHGI